MLKSLRSRLLLSYMAVIIVALSIVALALLAVSITQENRIVPTLRNLNSIGLGLRRELNKMQEMDSASPVPARFLLQEVAENQEVRLAIIDPDSSQVIFDSSRDRLTWSQIQPRNVIRPRGEFQNIAADLPIGRFQALDGQRWLLYSLPLNDATGSPLLLVLGQPEPGPLRYFSDTFLRPLCQAGLIAFLASILLAVLISRSVARPLQGMAKASESMAKGDFDQQLPLEGPVETVTLARSFNSMASKVKSSQTAQRDLVANVSHDLKTPLTAITGWSQALIDGTAISADEQRSAIEIIQGEAGRMERMIGQLLDLARLESGQLQIALEEIDLQQLITTVQQKYAGQALAKEVEMTAVAQPVPKIQGDYERLAQALSNLVDNALDHTPAGGRVRLILQPFGAAAVDIIVSDTGSGIPPSELERIFERFYQVDKSREGAGASRGSGIGLAIVKELVNAHQGQVFASSQIGEGSSFTIRLPISQNPDLEESQNPRTL